MHLYFLFLFCVDDVKKYSFSCVLGQYEVRSRSSPPCCSGGLGGSVLVLRGARVEEWRRRVLFWARRAKWDNSSHSETCEDVCGQTGHAPETLPVWVYFFTLCWFVIFLFLYVKKIMFTKHNKLMDAVL